jgi:amidase
MPTTPMKAPPLPGADVDPATSLGLAFAPLTNTMPFDNTHHPAMSVPCAMSNGLPVGMMLVGRHFEESTLYRAAHAFETGVDWRGP